MSYSSAVKANFPKIGCYDDIAENSAELVNFGRKYLNIGITYFDNNLPLMSGKFSRLYLKEY
jgi:hypothetical protein